MSDDEQVAGKLLSAEDRTACQQVATLGEGVHSQRAAALVAIDEGKTRAQAAKETGLTPGQVSYAVTLFRRNGLAMLPKAAEKAEGPEEIFEPREKVAKTGKKPEKGKGKSKKKPKKKAEAKKPKKDKGKAKAGKKKKKKKK